MIKSFIAAAGVALAFAACADAQTWSRPASFGGTTLQAGFSPDPHVRDLTAGGSIAASSRFNNCNGYIADAPDYSVSYTAGSLPLIFTVDSNSDTTLLINDPSGGWWCDDDGAEAPLNPLIRFDRPQSGRYDVWVGTYSSGSGVAATLFVSELGEYTRQSAGMGGQSGGYAGGYGLDISQPAVFGDFQLNGGFTPDPYTIWVNAGGNVDIQNALPNVSGCRGSVTSAPTVQVYYGGSGALHLYTEGQADTTLAVNTPNGSWFCNDDASGLGTDAGLSFSGAGTYDVYVGTYSGSIQQTRLHVSEIYLGYGRTE